ncbi:MAG: holo-ACP synthase [candidate division Zixibacteria bacterium]|nr:holo-ACP synthase [candidate division Zixibacteria bacterium]
MTRSKKIPQKTSIGVDITDISRFAKLNPKKDRLFLSRIYTSAEIQYCFSKAKPAQHLAARFAGKEAIVKALKGLEIAAYYKQIEISNDESGVPKAELKDKKILNKFDILLSLSHCEDKAIAFAIAHKKKNLLECLLETEKDSPNA